MSTTSQMQTGRADGATLRQTLDPPTGPRMWTSRLIGALFLAGFLICGTGSMIGAAAEIFVAPISMMLLVPGAIFELALAVWLLTRGLNPAVYDAPPALSGPRATPRPGR